jgi:hypothetical protein
LLDSLDCLAGVGSLRDLVGELAAFLLKQHHDGVAILLDEVGGNRKRQIRLLFVPGLTLPSEEGGCPWGPVPYDSNIAWQAPTRKAIF